MIYCGGDLTRFIGRFRTYIPRVGVYCGYFAPINCSRGIYGKERTANHPL
jgi:hypothetical protein